MATVPQTPPEVPQEPANRRTSLRRARGGAFSSGRSTESESLRSSDDLEEEDLNEAVRNNAQQLLPPPPAQPNAVPTQAGEEDAEANRRRIFEAALAGDASYAREIRLNLLSRLMMRGVAKDAISRELGVSLSTITNDVAELKRRFRDRARHLDVNELIGEQMAFYDEVTAVSLRITSQQNVPIPMRLAGARTALAAKADQTRFLSSAGVFDVIAFRRSDDGTDLSDVQVLMQRTDELLSRLAQEEAEPEASAAPVRAPVVRRRRRGAFNPMDFDDAQASGSGDEVVEL